MTYDAQSKQEHINRLVAQRYRFLEDKRRRETKRVQIDAALWGINASLEWINNEIDKAMQNPLEDEA